MKTFFKIYIITLGFFSFILPISVFSENEQEQLELIEIYVKNYKKNLKTIIKKYNIKDEKINNKDKNLNEILKIIEKTKELKDIEKKEKVIKYLNKNLKEINNETKEILRLWKDDFDKKLDNFKQNYIDLGKKISDKLDIIINLIKKSRLNKKVLSLKEYILEEKIQELKGLSILFKNFGDLKLNSEEEVKNKFKLIINQTKKTIFSIKEKLKD